MILKSKNIVLRPIKLADAPRFVRWFNDPRVNKFLKRRSLNLAQERTLIRKMSRSKTGKIFAIETAEGVHIGSIGLRMSNKRDRRGDLGIMIGDRHYWGKGLGAEAMGLLLRYGFTTLKLHRMELDVYSYNPRAIAVYKKLGFKKEGVRREHVWHGRKFHNTFHMGLLDREWRAL